jgi:Zn-dependent protease with chaperone function
MSTDPASVVPSSELDWGKGGTAGSGGRRANAFALPASTSFRFALLIAAVLASCNFIYALIYSVTPRGTAALALDRACHSRALAHRPSGIDAVTNALQQAYTCRSGAERVAGLWILAGIGMLTLLAGVIYCAQPWWYRRRMHLVSLTGEGALAVMSRLEQLRQQAGSGPVSWLLQPSNHRMSAFAFGRFRRRFVAVSGGAAVTAARQPAAFEAVILHELAHIRNKDVNQTYLAIAIWRAFVLAALLPLAGLLTLSHVPISAPRVLWRVAVLALTVYLLRNSVLRSREFGADARVREFDPDTSLGAVLAGLPPRRGRRIWHLGWSHPSGQARAAALVDPEPLYRCGFWDGLAIGLVAAIGAAAAQNIVYILITDGLDGGLIATGIFALFCGPAVSVAIWRKQFLAPETVTPRGWTVGLGLGIGFAVGPVFELSAAFDQGLAPDSLRPTAIGVFAVWIGLVTLATVSFPVWIGYWADAWQQRSGEVQPRVPARGGLLAASVAACVVLTISLWSLLGYASFVEDFDSTTRLVLARTWTYTGLEFAQQPGIWVVCLVFAAMPVAGLLASRRRRRAGGARDSALLPPRVWRTALLCLAGGLTTVVMTLAVDAVAHARIAAPIRWSGFFASYLTQWDAQAAVLIAVAFAMIAAARIKSAESVLLALAVAAIVATLGTAVAVNLQGIGDCFAPLSVQYSHPPASACLYLRGGDFLVHQVIYSAIEAVAASILVIPAAHYAGTMLTRYRAGRSRQPRSVRSLRLLAFGVAVIAVIGGTAFRLSDASAHSVQPPIGSIGRDGWIDGAGYQIRLYPAWYERTPVGGQTDIVNAVDGSLLAISEQVYQVSVIEHYLLQRGARPALLDGVRGLHVTLPGKDEHIQELWFVVNGPHEYLVDFVTRAADRASHQRGVTAMLDSWRWNAAG